MNKRQLVLEDGTVFIGEGFGDMNSASGEIIFNTSMTGYQEAISDPAYFGQMVMMTYPLIGNYGINRDDFEAVTPFLSALICKEVSEEPSNFRSSENINNFLKEHKVPGLSGIDTRKLTRIIREKGTLRGCIAGMDQSTSDIVEKIKSAEEETDQVKQVSTVQPYVVPGRGLRIVLVDFGMKHSILRELTERNCHVTVVPYNYGADKIRRLKSDGILLTNGPGDPRHVPEAIHMVKELLGELPLFGIGLGHQIFALACGADVEKLKFGHHGSNYPVKDLEQDQAFITAQNHNFAVTKESLEQTPLQLSHVLLNDQTVSGIEHKEKQAFSVQFNPESSPGPEDTKHLFDRFLQMTKNNEIKSEEK